MQAHRLTPSFLRCLLVLLLFLGFRAAGAVVGPLGYKNNFSLQPPAADWATMNLAGAGVDIYDPDAQVSVLAASGITAQLLGDGGNPPAANANALWSSSGLYLQTRPTGNRATLLVGKFVNNSGSNATQITLSYTFTVAAGGAGEDPGYGSRVYFSLTDAPNGWTNIAALNTTMAGNASFPVEFELPLTWTNGGRLSLLWLDDNSGDGTDSANQIDNFSLRITGGTPTNFFCHVTAPTDNAAFLSGAAVTASALAVNGTGPYQVEYFTNAGPSTPFASAAIRSTPPYHVELETLSAGTFQIYAIATDSSNFPLTTNSVTNTFVVAEPIAFALTSPLDGAQLDHTLPVLGAASVSGGTPPYAVQFFLNDAANGEPVMSAPYSYDFGPLVVGDYTVRATVTDAHGWTSNSPTHSIRITGPLAAFLSPADGTVLSYTTPLSLRANVGGGTPPYAATFFVNNQLLGTDTAAPFATNVSVTSAGSYSCFVRVTDSSTPPQDAYSSTNTFTLPPLLRIMPVGDSITLGIGAPGGYRAPLYRMLTNAGNAVDYVGTQTGNSAGFGPRRPRFGRECPRQRNPAMAAQRS